MSPEMKYCNPVNLTVKQHSLLLSARQCEQGELNHEVSVWQIILPDCLVGVYHYMHTRVFIRTSHTTLQGSITLHDFVTLGLPVVYFMSFNLNLATTK